MIVLQSPVITVTYNTSLYADWTTTDFILSLSLTLRPMVSRPVCLGMKHPSGAYNQIFITVG
jgi:hypothetical protein